MNTAFSGSVKEINQTDRQTVTTSSQEPTYQNFDGSRKDKNEPSSFGTSYQSFQDAKGKEESHDYEALPRQQTEGDTYEGMQDPALYYQMS